MPRKYRIKDVPVKDLISGPETNKGDIVYQCMKDDCGLADEDTHLSGIVHISVTLDENGDYPFFTVPIHNLEEITEEIKDCPFCGSKAHYVGAVIVHKLTAPDYVQCLECWAEMEGDGTPGSALIKWNKRNG